MNIPTIKSDYLYEMANFGPNTTGKNFDVWVDEIGKNRGTKHNLPRFRVEKDNVELDIIIDNNNIYFDKAPTNKLHKFGPYKDALEFIRNFKKPLLMHWNREIDTGDLALIFKLVSKKIYSGRCY